MSMNNSQKKNNISTMCRRGGLFIDAKQPGPKPFSIISSEAVTPEVKNCRIKRISKNGNGRADRSSESNIKRIRHCSKSQEWNRYSWLFIVYNFLFVYATCHSFDDSNLCAPGLHTVGRTWPRGDILLEYGQPLKIYCILNNISTDPSLVGKNASDLEFFREDVLIEQKYITVINETAISMDIEHPSPSQDMYYCKLRENDAIVQRNHAVCLNRVIIGFKPQQPSKFSCVSHNWENLVCSWDPVSNNIATQFSLAFNLPGRAGRRSIFRCPVSAMKYNDQSPNTCLWDGSTNPMYRQAYEYMTLILHGENVLGSNTFIYEVHHFARVIPAKPINLSVVNKTSSSVLMYWTIQFPMQTFPPGLFHRISYQNQQESGNEWQTVNITDQKHRAGIYFNLTNLQQANAVYKVRVSSKSSVAVDEDMWSEFNEVTFKTAPCPPTLPPKTDVGSFEIVTNSDNRDVYIYWQTIPQKFENGNNFKYQIVSVENDGHMLDVQPNEVTEAYAFFKGMSFNNLRFEIAAVNCAGTSTRKATVHVPDQLRMPQKPIVFTKIVFDGGIYEISWDSMSNLDIVDYTIFWCENDQDRPYQCTGYLDWVHVSPDLRKYNITVPNPKKIYQFAIATNTAEGSSGMVWASSRTLLSNIIGKIKPAWINLIKSDTIGLGWELEYSGRFGVIKNFNIHHCPIVSAKNLNCDGPRMVTTIAAHSYMQYGVVRNLMPHTTYSITITVSTEKGEELSEELHSDTLYITTLESSNESSLSENPTFNNMPGGASVPYSVTLSNEGGLTTLSIDKFDRKVEQRCNGGDGHCNGDDTKRIDSDTTNCMRQMESLTSAVSQCEKKLNILSEENRLLQQTVLTSNEIPQ